MKIWNGMESLPSGLPPVVASIGKCDGVHLGHQEILRSIVDAARRRGIPSLLISFDPHPAAVLAPERVPRLIQTRRQKMEALERTGLSDFLVLEFDEHLAAMNGETFFTELLLPRLRLAALFVGQSFRFGRGRSGDLGLLNELGARFGFAVHGVPPVSVDGEPVSSSAVRRAVEAGDTARATRMLGRPFALDGEVVEGSGRGREMHCPTANLRIENELLPRSGVYITETVALAGRHPSITNVGVRPTFSGRRLTVETHLLDFDADLYTERIEVRFLERLRDEMRFDGPAALADQIARDRAAALTYFHGLRIPVR